MAKDNNRLTTAILSAFCEAGNQMRFDVAQPLLRALAATSPMQSSAHHLDVIISIYEHLEQLMIESELAATDGLRAA